ncbi:hypothetical protein FA95DRAFT_1614297 [Auriscalpium vulgare]|uniref:Uncharacterized protein n=1 Tax=Auriscalpium vulgare TaxID=40419 RepID=A0ACB8R157_9AGAM|nr:hypothetical protein FA95DRAFT_1614297 [Auriscalpium vulgare]
MPQISDLAQRASSLIGRRARASEHRLAPVLRSPPKSRSDVRRYFAALICAYSRLGGFAARPLPFLYPPPLSAALSSQLCPTAISTTNDVAAVRNLSLEMRDQAMWGVSGTRQRAAQQGATARRAGAGDGAGVGDKLGAGCSHGVSGKDDIWAPVYKGTMISGSNMSRQHSNDIYS